jgi:hypothetical protein
MFAPRSFQLRGANVYDQTALQKIDGSLRHQD